LKETTLNKLEILKRIILSSLIVILIEDTKLIMFRMSSLIIMVAIKSLLKITIKCSLIILIKLLPTIPIIL